MNYQIHIWYNIRMHSILIVIFAGVQYVIKNGDTYVLGINIT